MPLRVVHGLKDDYVPPRLSLAGKGSGQAINALVHSFAMNRANWPLRGSPASRLLRVHTRSSVGAGLPVKRPARASHSFATNRANWPLRGSPASRLLQGEAELFVGGGRLRAQGFADGAQLQAGFLIFARRVRLTDDAATGK